MKKLVAMLVTLLCVCTLSACSPQPSENTPRLTADEALEIALEQAGVTRDSIRDLESTLESENGVLVYEIDFESGNTEYSYDINAETGAVVERDRDRND